MKKTLFAMLPFIIMPLFIPIYVILDQSILVDIFGCGCVPIAQTNMFNSSYNANDLRLTVFIILTILLSILGGRISKTFKNKTFKILYRIVVVVFNLALTLWVVKNFMWQ